MQGRAQDSRIGGRIWGQDRAADHGAGRAEHAGQGEGKGTGRAGRAGQQAGSRRQRSAARRSAAQGQIPHALKG